MQLTRETKQYLANMLAERTGTLQDDLHILRTMRSSRHRDVQERDVLCELSRIETILKQFAGESVLKKDVDLPTASKI